MAITAGVPQSPEQTTQIPERGLGPVSPPSVLETSPVSGEVQSSTLHDVPKLEACTSEPHATRQRHPLDSVGEWAIDAAASGSIYLQSRFEALKRMGRRAQERMQQLKTEKPLQVVGIIAASAFALGMAIRIWRSGREQSTNE